MFSVVCLFVDRMVPVQDPVPSPTSLCTGLQPRFPHWTCTNLFNNEPRTVGKRAFGIQLKYHLFENCL